MKIVLLAMGFNLWCTADEFRRAQELRRRIRGWF